MRALKTLLVLACALLAGATACSSEDPDGTGGGSSGTGGSAGGDVGPACTDAAEVPCSDQVIQQLDLQPVPAPGLITNEADGDGWASQIDATAGGFGADPPHSFVYGRFTDAGLEKVEIGDEAALESMGWDIAFRRYLVRINSGNSGPSCVTGTPIPGAVAYDDVTAVPENLPEMRKDEYFTPTCNVMIEDGNGLGSPATALWPYWGYETCVRMTDAVFIVQTQSGRRLKLTVTDYYTPEVQEQCDTTDMIPMSGSGAANFRVRWAFLP